MFAAQIELKHNMSESMNCLPAEYIIYKEITYLEFSLSLGQVIGMIYLPSFKICKSRLLAYFGAPWALYIFLFVPNLTIKFDLSRSHKEPIQTIN